MTWTVVASEYADTGVGLTVVCICVAFSAVVGRWWTLVLPVALGAAIFGLASIDAFYERTPEDVQAAVLFGAVYGLGLAAAALLVRHIVARAITKRRTPQTR
jgi:hypothetical protein